MLLAATITPAGQDGGWGHIAALVVAGVLAFYGVELHKRWRERQGDPSPTPPARPTKSLPAGETDDTYPDDTDLDDTDDTSDSHWGLERIPLADGSTLMRRIDAVWQTGSRWMWDRGDRVQDEAVDELEDVDEEKLTESRADFADRLVQMPIRYSDAVAEIMTVHNVSKRTAKRDLAGAQERAGRSTR